MICRAVSIAAAAARHGRITVPATVVFVDPNIEVIPQCYRVNRMIEADQTFNIIGGAPPPDIEKYISAG